MSDRLIINLPFAGFYNSYYSAELDDVEKHEAKSLAEEYGIDDAGIVSDALYWSTDYSRAHQLLAADYVQAFDHYMSEALGLPLGLEFESMTSPREYNFATDRAFAFISVETANELLRRVRPETMEALIAERFTSRSGFCSYYSNDSEDWHKPIEDWDHNELETLLLAVMQDADIADDWELSILYRMIESNDFDDALDSAVDWAKFKNRCVDAITERIEEIKALDEREGLIAYADSDEQRQLERTLNSLLEGV